MCTATRGNIPRISTTAFLAQAQRARGDAKVDLTVTLDGYRRSAPAGTITIVFGGKARRSDMWVDDDYVTRYVAQDPEHLIGFLSVDPTQDGWQDDLRYGHEQLGLRGIKLLPMYAGSSRTIGGSIRCGNTRSSAACPSCCTRARRSSARRRCNARCRGISMTSQSVFRM